MGELSRPRRRAPVIATQAIRPMPPALVHSVLSNGKEAASWTTRPSPLAACQETKGSPGRTARREATSLRPTTTLAATPLPLILHRTKPRAAKRVLDRTKYKEACAPEPAGDGQALSTRGAAAGSGSSHPPFCGLALVRHQDNGR